MNFASKRVWVPKRAADMVEDIDADEVSGGVRHTASKLSSARAQPSPSPQVRLQGANTNVVCVALGELKQGVTVQTGDLCTCQCGAAFSHVSKVEQEVGNNNNGGNNNAAVPGRGTWVCEFCGHQNLVSLEPEEIPSVPKVDYMLSGPTQANVSDAAYSVIFVVDTSGSMCCTVPVVGGLKIKASQRPNADLLAFREGNAAQYLPNERHNEQYVSRLQCVVAAVEAQVEDLRKAKPQVRVGLVTFASDVCILGDGTSAPVVITGDKLSNEELLLAQGREYHDLCPVQQSGSQLVRALHALEEKGTTALGPALLVALGMLDGAAPGSKVMLLTDGLANEGVGTLEFAHLNMAECERFYRQVATRAKHGGVACSVVAIKGSECKMEVLGLLAEESGGEVDIVDPTAVAKNFANILEDEVFAVDCELTMLLHRGMMLVDPEHDGKSVAQKSVGNITMLSNLSFEFRVRNDVDAEALSKQPRLPFQVQIRYRMLDGSKRIRVITEMQDVTTSRDEAEKDLDVDIVAANAVQQAGVHAKSGNYAQARNKMVAQQRMMARAAVSPQPAAQQQRQQEGYHHFLQNAAELDDALLEQERTERAAPPAANEEELNERRRVSRPDNVANAIYQQSSGKAFWRKK